MVMRFEPNTSIASGANAPLQLLFAFLDFMRTASPAGPGWTIPRSSDGATGGAGDYIADYNDLSTYVSPTNRSWFVLRSPDGSHEYLWFRYDTTDSNWQVRYAKNGDFTGGDVWNIPASATSQPTVYAYKIYFSTSIAACAHMGADDAAPYGFWMWSHYAGDFSAGIGSWASIPITAGGDPADPDLRAWFHTAGSQWNWYSDQLSNLTSTWGNPGWRGTNPHNGSMYYCCATRHRTTYDPQIPNGVEVSVAGKDWSFPMVIQRPTTPGNGFFKGVTDFLEWNGVERAAGDTFDSLGRISLGDVNAEWDGTTVPLSS